MFNVTVEKIGDVTVVHCEGRVVHSDAVFKLRDVVRQQRDAHMILLDLSEVESLEGGGVGILVFLQRWTRDRAIEFKLIDPSDRVRQIIQQTPSAQGLEIASMEEIESLLTWDAELSFGRRSAAGGDVLGQFSDHVSRQSGDDRARHSHHQ